MWERIAQALRQYPPRWWAPIINIYGGPRGQRETCQLTRVLLSPMTRWGRLYLHIFHREDLDRDPHDHPYGFWTFPINQGYTEDVFDPVAHCFKTVKVPAWRWTFRKATHCHRVTNAERGWPVVTVVWRLPTAREWGFWCYMPGKSWRHWTPWQGYVAGKEPMANHTGQHDHTCPGFARQRKTLPPSKT